VTKRSEALFRKLAPRIMRDLMAAFPWQREDAGACLGNLGHESGGFRFLQEKKPMVSGSRGGWGWAQWTGPRRRAFEAWVKQRDLDPAGYEANLGFLLRELETSEKATVPAVRKARGLEAKVKAFELGFERAGIKHYEKRIAWARIALDAFDAASDAPSSTAERPPVVVRPDLVPDEITDPHTVSLVQGWLRNLGYTEVGQPDGKIGTFTRAGIRAFRAENGLPENESIDQALIVALATAKPRQIAPARAEASPAEVRDKVPEAKATWQGKIASWWTAAIGGVGAALSGAIDYLGDARGYLEPVREFAGDVPGWVWFAAVGAGAFLLSRTLQKGEAASVQAFQEGARR